MTIYLYRVPDSIDTGWHECSRDAYEAHKGKEGFEVLVFDEGAQRDAFTKILKEIHRVDIVSYSASDGSSSWDEESYIDGEFVRYEDLKEAIDAAISGETK